MQIRKSQFPNLYLLLCITLHKKYAYELYLKQVGLSALKYYKFSISLSHMAELASLGILQSPLGLIEILPTLGPSGKQERLNC